MEDSINRPSFVSCTEIQFAHILRDKPFWLTVQWEYQVIKDTNAVKSALLFLLLVFVFVLF